jgi:hypothetical protein
MFPLLIPKQQILFARHKRNLTLYTASNIKLHHFKAHVSHSVVTRTKCLINSTCLLHKCTVPMVKWNLYALRKKTSKNAVYMTFEPNVQQTFGSYVMAMKTTNCLVLPSESNTKNYLLIVNRFLHTYHGKCATDFPDLAEPRDVAACTNRAALTRGC